MEVTGFAQDECILLTHVEQWWVVKFGHVPTASKSLAMYILDPCTRHIDLTALY